MIHVRRFNQRGFTLIEILIAITIVALMAAVVGLPVFRYVTRASKTAAKSTIKTLKVSIDQFYMQTNQYPRALKDLITRPTTDERIAKKWDGPYLEQKEVPEDPWGNRYQYKLTPGTQHPYELYSYGSEEGKATPKEQWISVWDE